ncbi:MAG TPA: M67 family metallopeptidase [Terriglobia bacterium]|nr:M67 family metallopeptidase [Terriglobia bacterium]
MIKIPSSVLREVYDHMEASYPHECCGLLVGRIVNENERVVQTFRKCRNLNTERAHDRYEMDPKCWLNTEREFDNSPWAIVGIYHSHPDHPSRASQTDTDAAWPNYSYVIASVQKGTVASTQSWMLNESEKKFYEEAVVVDEGDRK